MLELLNIPDISLKEQDSVIVDYKFKIDKIIKYENKFKFKNEFIQDFNKYFK